jgi:hypothetical protein
LHLTPFLSHNPAQTGGSIFGANAGSDLSAN